MGFLDHFHLKDSIVKNPRNQSGGDIVGVLLALLFGVCLFGGSAGLAETSFFESAIDRCHAVFADTRLQWLLMLCLGVYLIGFTFFHQKQTTGSFCHWMNPDFWLIGFILIGLLAYFLNYPLASGSSLALILFGGLVMGKAILVWKSRNAGQDKIKLWLVWIIILLAVASLWRPQTSLTFQYHGQKRWSGPWGNPNIYGLLMGVGVVLSCGFLIELWGLKPVQLPIEELSQRGEETWNKPGNSRQKVPGWLARVLFTVAVGLLGMGEIKSYSRGAWIGTLLGLCYLGFWMANSCGKLWKNQTQRWHAYVVAILLSMSILALWQFRHTEHLLMRRAFSVLNSNDFSWRNRLDAWKGALQMMAERPGFGFGWNQSEPIYRNYYRPGREEEGLAIQMNDYFTLGAMLGLPALICFVAYVWLRLTQETRGERRDIVKTVSGFASADHRTLPFEHATIDWISVLCRAAAIVLLVGFWFDGGLFRLETALLFWTLLALGVSGGTARPSMFHDGVRWGLVGFVIFAAFGVMYWAKASDPFQRTEFSLRTSGSGIVKGIVVRPKVDRSNPIIIWLHGSGGTLMDDGNTLRQLAELGMVVASVEYDQTNKAVFEKQFGALSSYLKQQPWGTGSATAWVGDGLGAQRMFDFLLKHSESQPQLFVSLSGGRITELDSRLPIVNLPISGSIRCRVLLVHGERDETFSVQEVQQWADRLRARGALVDLRILPDQGHDFAENRALVIRVVAEFCRHILAPAKPFTDILPMRVVPCSISLAPAFLWAVWCFYVRRRTGRKQIKVLEIPLTKYERPLKWLAGTSAAFAVGITTLHLVIPQLTASEISLGVARRILLPTYLRKDFDCVAANPPGHGTPLKSLLDYVELANYNRALVNWKEDEQIYQTHVLSPTIGPDITMELNLRRPLWEYFYPRIKSEQNPQAAATIVSRCLRERVTIAPQKISRNGVEDIWKLQLTDKDGFEAIYVAALRSVGVAARLNRSGQAELWADGKWAVAPCPIISSLYQ